MKILVIGAGIGGLAAALALQRSGVEVEVYERATELAEVGAGISLWANALHALDRLGVGDAIRAASVAYEVAGLRRWDGEMLVTMSAEDLRRQFDVATIITHRADLTSALLAGLRGDVVRLGKELAGLHDDGNHVAARFPDGSEALGDALI